MIAPAPANGTDAKTRIEVLTEEVSASRLKLFLSCRMAFFYRYVALLVKANAPALHVGRTLHGVLQSWNHSRWRQDFSFKSKLREVFDQRWLEEQQEGGIEWNGNEEKEREGAFKLLEVYLRDTPIPDEERPRGVEVRLESELKNGVTLIGVLDLVRGDGTVVDFKSTKSTPDPDRVAHLNELQLTCYGVLFRDSTSSQEAGYELHHLVKSVKTPKLVVTALPPITQRQIDNLHRAVDSYVEGVSRQDFVASPGVQCSSCPFFKECRNR